MDERLLTPEEEIQLAESRDAAEAAHEKMIAAIEGMDPTSPMHGEFIQQRARRDFFDRRCRDFWVSKR